MKPLKHTWPPPWRSPARAALAGCAGGPAARNIAVYDFGRLPPAGRALPASSASRCAPPPRGHDHPCSTACPADDPARRRNFAESRWVAPPAELIEAALKQRLSGEAASPGCRLTLEIDEFVQSFDAAGDSRAQLALRASLSRKADSTVLARQAFRLEEGAGAHARGGVAAHAAMQEQLAAELRQWLQATAARQCGLNYIQGYPLLSDNHGCADVGKRHMAEAELVPNCRYPCPDKKMNRHSGIEPTSIPG